MSGSFGGRGRVSKLARRGLLEAAPKTGSESDVRHLGPSNPSNLEAASKCVFVFLRDPKATLDIGACPSNPANPSNPPKASKLARRGLLEAASKCFCMGSESDVRHRGLPFKPLQPLKSAKSLETCQKGLARGCFKMCFFTGSKSDVRHRGLPFKPLKPLKSLKPLETCQKGLARGCVKMFLYGIRKRRETSGPARQTPQTPQILHQFIKMCFCFLTGSKSDVRHRGLPFKPLKPLKSPKSLETCQKGLARGCFKMFLYGIQKRR